MTYAAELGAIGATVDGRLAELEAQLAAARARIAELESGTPPPPPPAGDDNRYGMMTFADPTDTVAVDRDIDGIAATGSAWIRIGLPEGRAGSVSGTTWTPNTGYLAAHVEMVRKAKAAGLKVVQVMADTLRNSAWSDDQHRAIMSQYWGHVANLIGPNVDLWQIYNEHDVRDYRSYAPVQAWVNPNYLARFGRTLAAARTAIRSHSPAPVGTTVWGYPVSEAMYTRWTGTYDALQNSVDYIGIHAYPEKSASAIGLLPVFITRLAQRYGKRVYLGEFGLPDVGGYGTAPGYPEVGKAIVDQSNAIADARNHLICATLFTYRNRSSSGTGEHSFGVVKSDWTRKAYWQQVTDAIQSLPKDN